MKRVFPLVAFFTGVLVCFGCSRKLKPGEMMDRARALEKGGKRLQACAMLKKIVPAADSEELVLEAIRRYVLCMHSTGRLATVRWEADSAIVGEWPPLSSGLIADKGDNKWIAYYFAAYVGFLSGPEGFETAVKMFSSSIDESAGRFEPVYRLALLHLQRDDFDEAERLLRSALEVAPENPGVLVSLARCRAVKGDPDEALEFLRRAADFNLSEKILRSGRAVAGWIAETAAPMSVRERMVYNRAAALMERSLPGQASGILEEALQSSEESPALHRIKGMAHLELGNDSKAVVSLNRALSINPYDGVAAGLLGSFYMEKKIEDRAEKYLKISIRMNPFNLPAHRNLGDLLLRSERVNEAEEVLRRAVNLSLRQPLVMRLWAFSLKRLGRTGEAVHVLEESARKRPKDYHTWMMLGDLYLEQYGDKKTEKRSEHLFQLARRAYRKALEIQPGDLEARGRLHSLDPAENVEDFGKD